MSWDGERTGPRCQVLPSWEGVASILLEGEGGQACNEQLLAINFGKRENNKEKFCRMKCKDDLGLFL